MTGQELLTLLQAMSPEQLAIPVAIVSDYDGQCTEISDAWVGALQDGDEGEVAVLGAIMLSEGLAPIGWHVPEPGQC